MTADCIFCKIISGELPASKVYETDSVLAFHDIHRQAPTHILIVPRKHIARIADVQDEDVELMGKILVAAKTIAHQEHVSEGFRLVINNGQLGGQHVFHIHCHLLAGRALGWPPG